jgi:predicted permease
MFLVLIQMGALIVCGAAWRIIRPGGLDADLVRGVLTALVFNLFLPALVLSVLWDARLGLEAIRISLYGAALIFFGFSITWLASRFKAIERRRLGAAMLAAAFSNVTYMGLPVLEQTFGPWARAIAIQIDLFAGMPLVLTVGIFVARHYGTTPEDEGNPLRALLFNPPLWAAAVALALNLSGVPKPALAESILEPLARAVVPLMLVSLGLGLGWNSWSRKNLPLAVLVLVFKLMAMPAFGLWLALLLGFRGDTLAALVLEAAMPSMVLGVVFCDRYRLDTGFYAMLVTLSTALAMATLPFWYGRAAGM